MNPLTYLVSGLATGAFFALIALSMQVIYASSRILNFAQGVFVMTGSFLTSIFTSHGVPVGATVALLIPLGALAGALFYLLTIKPLFRHPNATPMTATLCTVASGAAVTGLFLLIYGVNGQAVPALFTGGPWHLGAASVTAVDLTMILAAVVAVIALFVFFRRTWLGRGMIAAAQNSEGATAVGIRTVVVVTVSFALSGALSFVAGALIGPTQGAQADLGQTTYILSAFTAALLGGLASPASAALGGLILGIGSAEIDGYLNASYHDVWLFIILAVALYLRPHGLFGAKRVVQ